MIWPFTFWTNCSSDLKNFANSWPSASNFKRFSRSLKHFFRTVGQNNFCNKIPVLVWCGTYLQCTYLNISYGVLIAYSHPVIFSFKFSKSWVVAPGSLQKFCLLYRYTWCDSKLGQQQQYSRQQNYASFFKGGRYREATQWVDIFLWRSLHNFLDRRSHKICLQFSH